VIVEVRKQHHVAIKQRWEVVAIGHYPLVCGRPRTKETVVDEALYARVAAIRAIPQIHGRLGLKSGSCGGGGGERNGCDEP
jgi:hypothetical protein